MGGAIMNGIKIDFNTDDIHKRLVALGYAFRDGSHRVIGSRAINRTLAHMRTVISAEIRKTYYLKKGDLDAAMRLQKATPRDLRGNLTFTEKVSVPLVHFGAKQGKAFVSVKVLRANRARRIQPGGRHKILETQKKKRAAVWIAKGQVLARVEGAERPIMLFGPSFMAYFKRPSMAEKLRAEAGPFFTKRLAQEADAWMRGITTGTRRGKRK